MSLIPVSVHPSLNIKIIQIKSEQRNKRPDDGTVETARRKEHAGSRSFPTNTKRPFEAASLRVQDRKWTSVHPHMHTFTV